MPHGFTSGRKAADAIMLTTAQGSNGQAYSGGSPALFFRQHQTTAYTG
jgi:hypothetical protein